MCYVYGKLKEQLLNVYAESVCGVYEFKSLVCVWERKGAGGWGAVEVEVASTFRGWWTSISAVTSPPLAGSGITKKLLVKPEDD